MKYVKTPKFLIATIMLLVFSPPHEETNLQCVKAVREIVSISNKS